MAFLILGVRDSRAQVAYAYGQPSYPQQYAPAPQPSYGQPGPSYYGYGQPTQPSYNQPAYGQQPYAQPNYNQPGYGQQADVQTPYGQPYSPQPYAQQGNEQPYAAQPGSAQPLNAQQLEQLVAPIALYPDTLVAQVLAAATYPGQVQEADRWRQAQGNASPYDIAGGADVQNWDPSVKALTAFPDILAELDRNIGWTSDLGNAYYNQPQDVLEAVQVMRQRAQASGNLQSTPQEQVTSDQGAIELAPPNPQVVYVPTYNPWTVYGDPVTPYPGFSALGAVGSFFSSAVGEGFGASPLDFGAGILMSAFNHTPWGWVSWGLNWFTNSLMFDHSAYATRSATVANWGLPRGRMFAYPGREGYRGGDRFGRGTERYGNGGYASVSNRGYARENYGYRTGMEAYNRVPAAISRRESYSRPASRLAYGPDVYNGRARAPMTQAYRPPTENSFGRENFGSRNGYEYRGATGYSSFRSPGSEAFRSSESRSGGFHLFGRGNQEPKMPKMASNRGFGRDGYGGGERSFFGGGRAPKAPKMSGGHSFGGGHSGGGHSSGGHSGGHGHHR